MPNRNELQKLRNEKIYNRYKELYDINFLRHEKVVEVLSTEFFLQPQTIQKIIISVKKQPKGELQPV